MKATPESALGTAGKLCCVCLILIVASCASVEAPVQAPVVSPAIPPERPVIVELAQPTERHIDEITGEALPEPQVVLIPDVRTVVVVELPYVLPIPYIDKKEPVFDLEGFTLLTPEPPDRAYVAVDTTPPIEVAAAPELEPQNPDLVDEELAGGWEFPVEPPPHKTDSILAGPSVGMAQSSLAVAEEPSKPIHSERPSVSEQAAAVEPVEVPEPPEQSPPEPRRPEKESPPVTVASVLPDEKPATRAEPPAPEIHRITARIGDQVSPVFSGRNWLFVGAEPHDRGLRYVSREIGEESTAFVFLASESGTYKLSFQQQDNSRGLLVTELLEVEVQTSSENRIADEGNEVPQSDGADLAAADSLYGSGSFEESLRAYLQQDGGDDPYINDRIAELSMKVGDYPQAVAYWQRNLSEPSSDFAEKAVRGIVQAVPNTGNPEPLVERIHMLTEVIEEPDALLSLADLMFESGHLPETARIYEHLLEGNKRFRGKDRVYFMLGKLYESDSLRDEKKAHFYYSSLLDRYPASRYYQEARERAQYLDSHFLRIR